MSDDTDKAEKERRAADRRKGADQPYTGPERRKHERRKTDD